jgi:hypothetical protein
LLGGASSNFSPNYESKIDVKSIFSIYIYFYISLTIILQFFGTLLLYMALIKQCFGSPRSKSWKKEDFDPKVGVICHWPLANKLMVTWLFWTIALFGN